MKPLLTFFLAFFCLPILGGLSDLDLFSLQAEEAEVTLIDLSGKPVYPMKTEGKKAAVLFFLSPYCPTSNTFTPEMVAIAKDFRTDFVFRFIHADPSVKEADRKQHAEMMEITDPVLDDPQQILAKRYEPKVTPEVVVIDAEGRILYQGRINDLYLAPTKRQREIKTHDLRDVLSALREGKAITNPRTDAIGCAIQYEE